MDGLLTALQARERTRATLEAARQAMRTERRLEASDAALARVELLTLADSWRRLLANNAGQARPIVAAMMNGRVTITPTPEKKNHWT